MLRLVAVALAAIASSAPRRFGGAYAAVRRRRALPTAAARSRGQASPIRRPAEKLEARLASCAAPRERLRDGRHLPQPAEGLREAGSCCATRSARPAPASCCATRATARSGSSTPRSASSRSCARSGTRSGSSPTGPSSRRATSPAARACATASTTSRSATTRLYMRDGYIIHGTIFKTLLGKRVTHGCIRLGDEDLEVRLQDGAGRRSRLSVLASCWRSRSARPCAGEPDATRRLRLVELEVHARQAPAGLPRPRAGRTRLLVKCAARLVLSSGADPGDPPPRASGRSSAATEPPPLLAPTVWTVTEGPGDTDRETIAPIARSSRTRRRARRRTSPRRPGARRHADAEAGRQGQAGSPTGSRSTTAGSSSWSTSDPGSAGSGASPPRCATAGCGSRARSRRTRRSSPW